MYSVISLTDNNLSIQRCTCTIDAWIHTVAVTPNIHITTGKSIAIVIT